MALQLPQGPSRLSFWVAGSACCFVSWIWGHGVFWVSNESRASEGWLCLFETLQRVYGLRAVASSQALSTMRQSLEATGRAGVFSAGRFHKLKVCQRWDTNVLT